MKRFLLNLILTPNEQMQVALSITHWMLEENDKQKLKELEELRKVFLKP